MNYNNANIGDKVKFVGKNSNYFWYVNLIENSKKLDKKKEYTISEISIASSWTSVKLLETGDLQYNLGWFEKI